MSCLHSRLARQGTRVASPQGLTRLNPDAMVVIDAWIGECAQALVGIFVAINCLIDPEAILIGGRLPATLIDRLAKCINEKKMAPLKDRLPTLAPVGRARLAEDAPAVGAAILPFNHQLLPTRFALFKEARYRSRISKAQSAGLQSSRSKSDLSIG